MDQCRPGGAGWRELRRKSRYLQHQPGADTDELAQCEHFVTLIEHGSTKDEACEQVYMRLTREASPETAQVPECPDDAAEAAARTQASPEPAAPAPLQPKAWRATLFTGVLALFGWERGRLNQNSRGMVNRAAMLRQESGIRPEQLPRLKQLFEQAYPKVRNYTPMALANHATEFVAARLSALERKKRMSKQRSRAPRTAGSSRGHQPRWLLYACFHPELLRRALEEAAERLFAALLAEQAVLGPRVHQSRPYCFACTRLHLDAIFGGPSALAGLKAIVAMQRLAGHPGVAVRADTTTATNVLLISSERSLEGLFRQIADTFPDRARA